MAFLEPLFNAGRPSGGCRTDPTRLKGIAMINLDDVPNAAKELERAARLGLSGAMITEYPLERRRYAMKAFYPALPLCDLIFSGVFERHTRLRVAIVEFELAWGAAPALHDGLHLPRAPRRGDHRFKDLPSRRPGTACSRATSSTASSC
jgi:hypothetical protein